MTPTPATLQQHARDLAAAFNARLIEAPVLKPHEAFAVPPLRLAVTSVIVDETTYAVALHELGHLAAPAGVLRGIVAGNHANLSRVEEDAAWTWARHYALTWTPAMEAVASWAEGTYQKAGSAPAPSTPPQTRINWEEWK